MPLGSIMIVWQGSGPGRLGNAQVYAHNYSLYLRAPEIEDVGYEDICDWIVNDVPVGGSLKMLHTPSIRTASRWISNFPTRNVTLS